MDKIFFSLIEGFNRNVIKESKDILHWSCPVPFFGNIQDSKVATVGLNPSSHEFINTKKIIQARFPNLYTLSLNTWENANAEHIESIKNACLNYFERLPYKNWFNQLEYLFEDLQLSYYKPYNNIVHLDLFPYATIDSWGKLASSKQKKFLASNFGYFYNLITDTKIQYLYINGRSVLDGFIKITDLKDNLKVERINDLDLISKGILRSPGNFYTGSIQEIEGHKLDRKIRIIGINHNLQSSFGISNDLREKLKKLITSRLNK